MRIHRQFLKAIRRNAKSGFALVITLSLMILLTVIAVGMLTLGSISIRASSQGEAMAMARANARLAVLLALGDLQKSAGPDYRVTARADIKTGNDANGRLTGVWGETWQSASDKATKVTLPTVADYDQGQRDQKFQGWLVSGTDPAATKQIDYLKKSPSSPVQLWGTGTLGDNPPANSLVSAGKIPVAAPASAASGTSSKTGNTTGAVAWAVLDEGVKARINTRYADDASSTGMKTVELGAGERPGVEFITGLNSLERKFFEKTATESATIDKGITRLNFGLTGDALAKGSAVREALRPLTHDVTTQSIGLFTDTARGGLKQDFQLMMNDAALPKEYLGKGVYQACLGGGSLLGPAEPTWDLLHQYASLYHNPASNPYHITASGGVPLITAQTPTSGQTNWSALDTTKTPPVINRTPPPGLVLLPTIAKVQVLFSLVGRDLYRNLPDSDSNDIPLTAAQKDASNNLHGPQDDQFRGTRFDYDLHLMYEPIVTLHNPYNVALQFTNLHIEFINVPFAMQVFRNGEAQSTGLVPLDKMFSNDQAGGVGKLFGMNLKTKVNGAPGDPTFTLMPGEVKLFTPYLNPDSVYASEMSHRTFWDIVDSNDLTTNMNAMPGWVGDGVGFDCDWLAGDLRVANNTADNGHWEACLGLAYDDKIHVLFAPLSNPISNNKFIVKMTATTGNSTSTVSAIEIDYEKPTGLQEFIASNGVTMPMRYPKNASEFVLGKDLVERSTKPIKNLVRPKAFALLSVQGKTTSGGRDLSNIDGRLATKPWCFAHANVGASTQKVLTEHSANFSHEIDLQVLPGTPDDWVNVDQQDRSNFMSGQTGTNGTKFGLQYEIPLAPLQTLAGLNGANPGGFTSYLPRFAQPIGNSWAHPLISPEKLVESGAGANVNGGANYLDHSFLLNLALYDRFYFSGLADQSGPFCTPAKTTANLASDFAAGKSLDDPRLLLHPPDGKSAKQFTDAVTGSKGGVEPYKTVASWQMMQGAFNVNSTSAPAWKAMLASIHDKDSIFNQLNKVKSTSSFAALTATTTKEARISRYRLPASQSFEKGGDSKDGYWLGPREYSDDELTKLADQIVKQVQARGPFFSLADFVNRRLGSDDTAQRGALQQAIDDSGINKKFAATAGQNGAGFEIPAGKVATYKYKNAAAGTGSSYQGAPGFLAQADILNVLGNAATARSDTFTIRGYGEARDKDGKVLARATCEATVQRYPEWVDPTDKVETPVATLQSKANKNFGRRFLITSVRWLNSKEI